MRLLLSMILLHGLAGQAFAHGGEDHSHDEPAPVAKPVAGAALTGASQRLADGSLFVPKPAQRALGIRTVVAEQGDRKSVV